MSVPVIVRPAAVADIEEIAAHLKDFRLGLEKRFAAQLRELLERIEAMPELYGAVWEDVRAARLKRFRYVLYYVVFEQSVEVLAILHGARDPAAWQARRGIRE